MCFSFCVLRMNDSQEIYNACQQIKLDEEICCTCLKKDFATTKITDLDYDGRTFLEKITACVCPTLEIHSGNIPRICRICLASLNLAFNFRKTALNSLKTLNLAVINVGDVVDYDEDDACVEVEEAFADDQDHISFSNDNDTIELDNAVLLLRNLQDNGRNGDGSRQFGCDECSLDFRDRKGYVEHMMKIHNKKLQCELCSKSFKTWSRLKAHIPSHTNKKQFNCSHCDKTFPKMSSLKRHMTSHYLPPGQKTKKTPFLCTICGKSFPYSNGGARHMRTHLGIKTHQCQICNKQFNQSTHLHVHMRTHSGEKPFICEICGSCFALKFGLQKHIKSKHSQSNEDAQHFN